VWIERVSHGDFSGSLLEFWPHYFDGWYAFGGNFAWMGLHLWYLEMLFLWSLITLPIFLLLRKLAISGSMSRVAGFFKKPAAIFLPAVPLVLMELLVNLQRDGVGIREFGGWSPFTYVVFFIIGYLLATDSTFLEAAEKHRIAALVAVIVLFFVGLWAGDSVANSSIAYQLESIFRGLYSWCWLVAILGFGRRYLNNKNAFLQYANEAVLPFYILHQTVIVVIAFFMVDWQAGIGVKYALLWIASFLVIMGLYEGIVKRLSVTRFLFGLKPLKNR
jgi:surface polysaccharide O-acyltransferase-like enzyme